MLGLGNNLMRAAMKLVALITGKWDTDHDYWEAAHSPWEDKTTGDVPAPPGPSA